MGATAIIMAVVIPGMIPCPLKCPMSAPAAAHRINQIGYKCSIFIYQCVEKISKTIAATVIYSTGFAVFC